MNSPSDLSPEEVTALREEHDLIFREPPDEASPAEAEREVDRLLRAYAEAEAQIAANDEAYKAEVQRAEQWRDRVNRTPLFRKAWILRQIEATAPFVRRFGKAKSRELPHGTVGWRLNPERIAVEDLPAAVGWARSKGIPVDMKEAVAIPKLSAAWKEERARDKSFVPPGCRVIEAEDAFYVNLPRGGVG